jgi:hypothetical protein
LYANPRITRATTVRRQPLLKRTIIAGGGALIAIVNGAPPPGIPIPPAVTDASITAGIWLLDKAAEKQADAFHQKM